MKTLFQGTYKNQKTGGSGIGLIPGLAAAFGILLISVSLITLLIMKGTVKPERISILSKILYVLAMTGGCLITAKKARSAKLLWAGLTGCIICVIVLGATGVICGLNEIQAGLPLVLTVVSILIGGMIGAREKRASYL